MPINATEDQLRKDLTEDRAYFLAEVSRLHSELAEREAEIVKLRAAADTHCKAMEDHGYTNLALRKALSTPPSTNYLEQWEKNRYQVVGYFGYEKVHGLDVRSFSDHQCKLHNALLYARKD